MMKNKATLFIILTVALLTIGVVSFYMLLPKSKMDKTRSKLTNILAKSETYKSTDKKTNTEIRLNYKDSTYTYREHYILKPGEDLTYEKKSKGQFKMEKDTVIFYSDMPSNEYFTDLDLTAAEIVKNRFSYIFPIHEKLNANQVKIYFDNIAEINDYKAFTIVDHQLKPLKIIERREMEEEKLIKTKNDNFFLKHYLIVEKPANRQLIITGSRDDSFLFDYDKIPYRSFHFFTGIYGAFCDLTGLKFQISAKGLKKIKQPNDNRYSENAALNSDFIKQ